MRRTERGKTDIWNEREKKKKGEKRRGGGEGKKGGRLAWKTAGV